MNGLRWIILKQEKIGKEYFGIKLNCLKCVQDFALRNDQNGLLYGNVLVLKWFCSCFCSTFWKWFESRVMHTVIFASPELYYLSFFITGQISDLPSNTMFLFFISVKWDQIGKSHMLRDPFLYPSQKCTDLNKCRADGNCM